MSLARMSPGFQKFRLEKVMQLIPLSSDCVLASAAPGISATPDACHQSFSTNKCTFPPQVPVFHPLNRANGI